MNKYTELFANKYVARMINTLKKVDANNDFAEYCKWDNILKNAFFEDDEEACAVQDIISVYQDFAYRGNLANAYIAAIKFEWDYYPELF